MILQKSNYRYQYFIYISLFILLYCCSIVFSYSSNSNNKKSPQEPQIENGFLNQDKNKENKKEDYIDQLILKGIDSYFSVDNSDSSSNKNNNNNFNNNNNNFKKEVKESYYDFEILETENSSEEGYHISSSLQNVTLSINMTGGVGGCTDCDGDKDAIYFDNFACNNGNGDWNSGEFSFQDPLPYNPNNQTFILKRIALSIYGNYQYIDGASNIPILIFLGAPMINYYEAPSNVNSTCPNCALSYDPIGFVGFSNGLQGYKYGHENYITFQITSNDNITVCFSRVDLTFYYGPVNYKLNSISPSFGTSDGNQMVTITGSSFYTSNDIICRFGSNSVYATYVNDSTLICSTPALDISNLAPGESYSSILQVSEDGGVTFSYPIYFLYKVPSNPKQPTGGNRLVLIVATTVGSVSLFLSFLAVFYCFKRYKRGKLTTIGDKKETSPLLKSDYKTLFEIKPIDIGEIVIQNRIGRGSCAEVFTGTWRGITVAIKKAKLLNDDDEDFLNELAQEATIMSQLRHPNICQFLGTCKNPPEILIVMEYMPMGSLYRILHDSTIPLDWARMKSMALDIAKGMNYLHCSDPIVIHRDLKSHNLLVDEHFRVKISDFGLSTRFKKHLDRSTTMTPVGTPAWSAPEVIRNQHYTEKADVYSFGIVLWECATRMDPYAGLPTFQVICAVGKEGLRPPTPKSAPPEFIRLIIDCWAENPSQRPSFQEIVKRLESIDIKGWGEIPFIKFNPIALNQNQNIQQQLVQQQQIQILQNQNNNNNNNNSNNSSTTSNIIINNLI